MTAILDEGIDDRTVEYRWWVECLECGGPVKTDGWGCCYHCGSELVNRAEVIDMVRCPARAKRYGTTARTLIVDALVRPAKDGK
jgi:hypothetical protein